MKIPDHDKCKTCRYYLPWITTSQGEINDACVIFKKRVIRRAPRHDHNCEDYDPTHTPIRKYVGTTPDNNG